MVEKEYRAVSAIDETKILILRKIARIMELETELLKKRHSMMYPISVVTNYSSEILTFYRFLKPFMLDYIYDKKPDYKKYDKIVKNEKRYFRKLETSDYNEVDRYIREFMDLFQDLILFCHDYGLLDITYFVGTSSEVYDE